MLHGFLRFSSMPPLGGLLALLFFLVPNASAGPKVPGIQQSVGGTISNHLPRPRDDQRVIAEYPALGSIRLTTTQYCGDSDVASFSSANPGFDFVSNATVSFVLGYWIVPEGSNPVPTESNWNPLGSGTLSSNNGSREDLTAIGKKGAVVSISQLVNNSLNSLASTVGYRMTSAGPAAKHELYYAVLMCRNTVNPSNAALALPQPYDVGKSFQNRVLPDIEAAVLSANKIESLKNFGLSSDENGVKINANGGPLSVANDPFYLLATSVMALVFPTAATDVPTYQQALAGPVWDKLSTLHGQFYGKANCIRSEITGVENSGPFPWELTPLNLSCMALSAYNGVSLDVTMKAFLMPANLPTEPEFIAAQLELAKALSKAAMMQQSQIAFASSYKRPKDTCFVNNQLYVNKVMGSQPINIVPGKSSVSSTMVHPEGSMAIGEVEKYRGANGNYNTIFKMSTEPFQPLILTEGQVATPDSVLTKSYLLRFNVRGIGCSNGVIFCKNEGGVIAQ